MATTNTTLYKIELPNLSSNSFGSDLRQAFENIDSNFQKLSTLGLTTGAAGAPAIWVPFDLNCVFKGLDSDNDSFIKYQEIINGDENDYWQTCFELYKLLLDALPDDSQQVGIYKHKWEYDYAPFSDRNTPYDDKYDPYLPGILLIAGNVDVDDSGNHSFRMLGSTAHIYMDPRFRAQLQHTPMSEDIINQMAQATDQSCVLYGKAVDITEQNPLGFEFEYVYAFPRIYCGPDGNFYLNINNINTNIPLNGRAGAAGKDANIVAVHLSDDISPAVIDDILYNNDDSQNGQNLKVTTFVGTNTAISPEDAPNLDGCPALIFPPTGYGRYGSFYWVGYLSYGSSLTAYCGRENLITTDIYEHNFGGMMMGLDMYEVAKARPAGNAPWYKPRGLMLPIGTRAYGDYWDPRDDTGSQPNTTQFGAHLIYSKKDASNLKKEIHLSSVQDYRSIGSTLDGQAQPDYTQNISRVDGTVFVIDEPVKITNYGDESSLYNGNILTAFGSSLIKGNEHIDGHLTVDGYGTIGEYLCVGAGSNNGIASGDVYANKFYRRNENAPGQILMANGWSTSEEAITIEQSVTATQPSVRFIPEDNSDGDGNCHWEITIPKSGAVTVTYGDGSYFCHNDGSTLATVDGNTFSVGEVNTWDWSELSKAIPSDITIGSRPEQLGLKGVYFYYTLGNLVYARVLIAANSTIDDSSSVDTFGLPIEFSDGRENEIPRFENIIIVPSASSILPHPVSKISQFWGAQSGLHYNGGWKGDKAGKVKGSGCACSINANGSITLDGAQVRHLFTKSKVNNTNKYIEFDFIYIKADESSSQSSVTYYIKYSGTNAPADGASTNSGNWGNWSESIPSDSPGNWYLISATKSYASNQSKPAAPTKYYTSDTDGWHYTCTNMKPSGGGDTTNTNVSYQWKGTGDNYNIISYLAQTQLAMVNNDTASGDIIDVLRSSGTSYGRYDGPHGTVSITKTDNDKCITVEAWDQDWGHINCNSYNVTVAQTEGNDPENISFDEGQQTITVTLKSNQNS